MSYLALARKWRPRTFSELVGQEHVNKVLINSLNQQRLHHAYLFTGTRGVGKTSVARLLAKALNCEQGISADPCLHCDACVAIEEGRFIDLIEIDGASRTRVEDTRELLENVQYSPAAGRFKIYLIDEVHMLSQHSFAALLKTLEEPPAHVKFLLATSDPQKLPAPFLSRCLQCSLRPLAAELISRHLQSILKDEQLSFDDEALVLLAKAARGSMRDALSLLDQVIASVDTRLSTQDVKTILGYTQQDYAIQLLHALANLDSQQLVRVSRQIALEGGHFRYVLDELLDYLHQMTVTQSLPDDNPLISPPAEIKSLARQFAPEDVQLFYEIGIRGTEGMHLAPTLAIGFEMTLLRMLTFRPTPEAKTPPLAYKQNQPAKKSAGVLAHIPAPAAEIPARPMPIIAEFKANEKPPRQTAPESLIPVNQAAESSDNSDWGTIVSRLKLTGLTLSAAENSEFVEKTGCEISLRTAKGHQSLFTPTVIARMEQALSDYYKERIKIALGCDKPIQSSLAQQKQTAQNLRQQEAELNLQKDPFFQQLRQTFSAELVKNSIAPVEDEL